MDEREARIFGLILLLLFGPSFEIVARSTYRSYRRFRRCLPATARVIAVERGGLKFTEDEVSGSVTYEYRDKAGKVHVATRPVALTPRPHEVGASIAILYDPADPGWNSADRWWLKYGLQAFLLVFTFVFLLAGLVMLITGRNEWQWPPAAIGHRDRRPTPDLASAGGNTSSARRLSSRVGLGYNPAIEPADGTGGIGAETPD